jgi:hypothetical protein
MPVVQVSRAESRDVYEAVASRIDMAGNRPPGLILHSASETASGEVEIVDVWETAEDAGHFASDRLFPIFQAVGMTEHIQSSPQPVAYEPFDYVS